MGVAELLALSGKRVLEQVRQVYGEEGPFTTVALDVGRAKENAHREVELRWRALLDELRAEQAPERHIPALEERAQDVTSLPGEVRRTLVVTDRGVVLDVEHESLLPRTPLASVGQLPCLVPLLADATNWVPYLVVEVGRTDATIHLRVAGQAAEWEHGVEGQEQYAHKAKAGGWSELRWQHSTEEVWHGNLGHVADEAGRIAHATGVELLVVAGDVRARSELAESLRGRTRADVVQVDVHTKPAGADDAALTQELLLALDQEAALRLERLLQRIRDVDGTHGAVGLDAVLRALEDGQVDTLLMRPSALRGQELEALRDAPWLGAPTGTTSLGTAPAAEVLARAALLTDAHVMVVEVDVPELAQGVAAALRWPRDQRRS